VQERNPDLEKVPAASRKEISGAEEFLLIAGTRTY